MQASGCGRDERLSEPRRLYCCIGRCRRCGAPRLLASSIQLLLLPLLAFLVATARLPLPTCYAAGPSPTPLSVLPRRSGVQRPARAARCANGLARPLQRSAGHVVAAGQGGSS